MGVVWFDWPPPYGSLCWLMGRGAHLQLDLDVGSRGAIGSGHTGGRGGWHAQEGCAIGTWIILAGNWFPGIFGFVFWVRKETSVSLDLLGFELTTTTTTRFSLHSPGWPLTHWDPPASALSAEMKTCTTNSRFTIAFQGWSISFRQIHLTKNLHSHMHQFLLAVYC